MKRKQFKSIVFEAICKYYQGEYRKALLTEDRDKNSNMVFAESEGEALPDSMEIMLNKFPTLRHGLQRLMTDQYSEFVSGIDWVSPKPTQFRINLKNGQNFTLKWMGKDFEATISGKRYYLGQLVDFQQALNRLSILYTEGPMGKETEQPEGGEEMGGESSGFTGGGAADFPGESPEGGPEMSSADLEGGEAAGPETEPVEGGEDKDMSDQEIDFETDTDI